MPAALPSDHDDHHGGPARRAAARSWPRRRRGAAPAARHRHRRRPDPLPVVDALYDAGGLSVCRPLQRLVDPHRAPPAGGGSGMNAILGRSPNYWPALLACMALAGCMVGPDYRKPEAPAPAEYKELDGWRQAEPRDQLPRGSWWTVFGDAELDKLMQRVDISNQNIKVAEARLRQARGVADQARAGLFPTLSANASGIRTKSPSLANQPNFANGAVNNYAVGLSASWALDLWGACAARWKRARPTGRRAPRSSRPRSSRRARRWRRTTSRCASRIRPSGCSRTR